jgi:translin
MPSRYNDDLSSIAGHAIDQLTLRHQAREQALAISREVIRFSANGIRAVHRGEFEEARGLIDRAGRRLKETEPIRMDNPEIYYAGFLSDARKEYSEANITLAVISGSDIPGPGSLDVDATDYLNGIAEVIGELRRYILDALRRDSFNRCDELMEVMDEIYGILVTVDFPEAVTGGLRRSTDAMRGVLERTRGDLTMALRQRKLEVQLGHWQERMDLGNSVWF